MPAASRFCGQCGQPRNAPARCSACGHPVVPGSRFCGECGAPVHSPDPALQQTVQTGPDSESQALSPSGESVPPPRSSNNSLSGQEEVTSDLLSQLMPNGLAAKIKSEAPLISGERREVTVLFAHVAGFNSTRQELDSEDIYLLTDEAMRLLVQIVYQYEGNVDKFTSHGLMALFGAPVAHENDPERAVRAALAMQEQMITLRQSSHTFADVDFQIRIGINTGVVIAGSLGSDLHMEYTVIGDTVNMASRLEGVAQPGTVLVSFSSYQRTRPLFDFQVLPPLHVKGKPEPIRAYRPTGLRANPERVRGLAGLQVPMVGRQDMLEELLQTWAEVQKEQRCRIALVSGDAGLGKSRLVSEFRRHLPHAPTVYQGSCLAYTRSTPFWILGSMLRDILQLSDNEAALVCQERIRDYLQKLGLQANELTPYILNILGVEQPSPELSARLSMMDAAMLQQQTHIALHQMVRAEAHRRELILILEDIHWIDSASRNFAIELLRTASDLPIFFVLITRAYERTTVIQPIIALLEKQTTWSVDIQLQALNAEQEYQLVDQLLSQAGVQIPAIHQHIARRAEGNPFYIEEIVRMLLDQIEAGKAGVEEKNAKGAICDREQTIDAEALMRTVPGTLTGLILARFDALGDKPRHAMQIAAVIGRTFPMPLLQQLLHTGEEGVFDLLAELVERQFLIEEPLEHEIGFSFRHTLIQEAVYGTLLNRTRRQFHGAVAAALNDGKFLPPDERTEALAYHYSHGEEPGRAIPFLVTAAQNAARRSAYESAIQFYRRALVLFDSIPERFSRIYGQIHIGLGSGLKLSGEFEEARQLLQSGYAYLRTFPEVLDVEIPLILETLRELADVSQRAGNFAVADDYLKEALNLAISIKDSPLWYSLVERKAWVQFRLGDLDESVRLAREALQYLEERPDQQPFTLSSFYNTMGGVAWQQGNLSEAITYVEASLKMYELQGFAWGISVACANLGILHWTLGHWAAGTEWYERAAKIQAENGFSFEQAISLRNLGYLRMAQGDMEIAHHHLEQSLALCLQQSHSYGALATHLALGDWADEMGDAAEVSRQLQAARAYEESADTDSLIILHLLTARDFVNRSYFVEAIHQGQQALQLANEGQMQAEMIEANHILGVIYGKADEFEKAEHHLETARQLAKERSAPDRVANAQLEMALLYERMIHTEAQVTENWKQESLELVRQAIAQFEQLGARLKLHRARSLEEKLIFHSTVDDPWATGNDPLEPAGGIRISVTPSQRLGGGPAGLPSGEKAYVTILWVNVDQENGNDEEEAFSQMAEALGAVAQIIQHTGGHLIRHPHGLAAAFGAPTVYEDSPQRALRCAESIAKYLDQMIASNRGTLRYQIGLDHGDAIAGFLDPSNQSLFVVTGPPVTRAEGLAQAAPAAVIWLSDTLAKLADASDHCRSTQPEMFQADSSTRIVEFVPGRPVDQIRPKPRRRTRLVGRGPILDILRQHTEALTQNQSGFIWLEGEAGIGKSRLLDEFGDILDDSAIYIWNGHCTSPSAQQPFALFSSLLQNVFDFASAASPDERRARLEQQLQRWTSSQSDVQIYLELLCGIPPTGSDAQRLANLVPEALRQQIFVAVRTLLVGMVQQQPLVLVLDDLHWIDPMSASLLVFLSQMVASMPVLFILAHRPVDGENPLRELDTIRSLHAAKNWHISLSRLSRNDSKLLLSELLPSGELSLDAHRFILERSDGNPYYMEEFLRLLIEQGHLHQEGNIWSPQPATRLSDLPLPVSLEAMIRFRVDSLPGQQRQLLQMAAVIGRPFPLDLMERLAPALPVPTHMQELARRNLLVTVGGADEWRFSHHIAQIVVYNGMLRVRLKALHLQVADTLETEWEDTADEHAEELAHHLFLAEEADRALRYLVLAGAKAEARYANDEALSYYRRAREILHESAGVVPDELRWRVIVGLGDTYRFVGKYDLSLVALEEGVVLAQRGTLAVWRRAGIFRRLGQTSMFQGNPEAAYDHFRQALVALEEPDERLGQIEAARTLYYLTYTHFRRGQWEKAKETCELCRLYAEKANDLSELAAAENLLGGIAYQQGERETAVRHTEMALELRERVGYTWGVASTMGNLAILTGANGDWDRAKHHFQRSLFLRQELGDMEGVAIMHNNLGWLGRVKGTLAEAEGHFQECLKVAETFKMIYHAANAMLGIGHIRQISGDLEQAQRMISGSVDRAEQVDAQDLLSEIYRVQADILLERGTPDEAEESARWAVLLASESGSAVLEADAWRVVSECLYRQGHLRRAEETIKLARAAQPTAGDTIECGRVATQTARLLCATGRFAEAEIEFNRAEKILNHIGAAYDLQQLHQERSRPLVTNRPDKTAVSS